MKQDERVWTVLQLDEKATPLGSIDFKTRVAAADEWGYYSARAYRPRAGANMPSPVLAYGSLDFVGEGGAGSDARWYMPNRRDVFIAECLYCSDDERRNARVEQALRRGIRRLVREALSSGTPVAIVDR